MYNIFNQNTYIIYMLYLGYIMGALNNKFRIHDYYYYNHKSL